MGALGGRSWHCTIQGWHNKYCGSLAQRKHARIRTESFLQLLKIVKNAPGKSSEQIDDQAVLLRAYGNNTDILIDRDREAQSHALLAKRGLAPQLLARFNNGLLYNFIQGRACTPQDLVKEEVWRSVARRLAEWHSVPLPSDYYATSETNGMNCVNGANTNGHLQRIKAMKDTPTPNVWTVMQKWIDALPTNTAAERSRRSQLQSEVGRSFQELSTQASSVRPDMVFGHCDLLSANIIILPSGQASNASDGGKQVSVRFIDYEYGTACPAAFDIANHFAEWGGYDCDYTMLPNHTVRRLFLEEYLKTLAKQKGQTSAKSELDILMNQVDDFRGIPGLYWGIWALIQATISQIDFDYASYAEVRLGEYFAWRQESDGTRKGEKEMPLRERCWAKP